MIPFPSDEVAESQAPPAIAEGYEQVRTHLGSSFVPTVYRRLAMYPEAFAVAVRLLADVAELGRTTAFPERARSVAHVYLPPAVEAVPDPAGGVSEVIGRYREANPLNLLFSTAAVGELRSPHRGIMEPPLPAPAVDIWEDIRACHAGPIIPGLWRDLAPWSDDLSRLWRTTRDVADTGAIASARDAVKALAQDVLSEATMTVSTGEILGRLPEERAHEFTWFPTGVATMIAEGELLHLATHTRRNRPRKEPDEPA